MHKPIQVTDKNLNVQEASEGEVSFGRPKQISNNMKEYLNEDAELRRIYGYCPVDDEHSQNKI